MRLRRPMMILVPVVRLVDPVVVKNNKAFPLDYAPRPIPKVPSIYEWQQKQ